jgi:hypothetical protein
MTNKLLNYDLVFHDGSHYTDRIAYVCKVPEYYRGPDIAIDDVADFARMINDTVFDNKRMWIDLRSPDGATVTHWLFNY